MLPPFAYRRWPGSTLILLLLATTGCTTGRPGPPASTDSSARDLGGWDKAAPPADRGSDLPLDISRPDLPPTDQALSKPDLPPPDQALSKPDLPPLDQALSKPDMPPQ